jgi:transcriptional regulator with XRE-family HTH domain
MDPRRRDRLGLDIARQQTRLIRELKAVRVASGTSVAQVAAEMGVDQAVVYRFEKGGTNPTLATVRRYALAVGAMLDLGAKAVSAHDTQVVRTAASSIDGDPARRAEFFAFHDLKAAPERPAARESEGAAWTRSITWVVDARD